MMHVHIVCSVSLVLSTRHCCCLHFLQGTQEGQSVALVVQDLTPSQLNAAIQSSGLTTQHNIRKFTDFEDHSVEIDSQKQEDKDSDRNDFRNLFVDALAF